MSGHASTQGFAVLRVLGGWCFVQTAPGRPALAAWQSAVEAYLGGQPLSRAAALGGMSATGLHGALVRMGHNRSVREAATQTGLSAEVLSRAEALLARGLNARQAAHVLGVRPHRLRVRLARAGQGLDRATGQLRSLRSRRVVTRRAEVQRRLAAGERTRDLAAALGVCAKTVRNDWNHSGNPFR